MLAVGLAAAAVGLTAAFFFLSRRGFWRWLSLGVFVLAPIAVLVVFAVRNLLWVAVVSAAAWLLASMTARLALTGEKADWRMPEHPAPAPAARPYLIMNPRSGGGKVEKFDLKRKAEELGAEVFLMSGPELVDVAEVAREAVARGADLLGVAGGDGTQALVAAGIAAEHGIPFMVITAGTRNHFALDLGLDRENPAACLGALSNGVELHVDLGVIRRPDIRQQRVVRCVRGGRREPGLPWRQAEHHPEAAPGPAARPPAGRGSRPGRTAWRSGRRRLCWWPTTRTEPGTSPA